jgi:hypothetical protein
MVLSHQIKLRIEMIQLHKVQSCPMFLLLGHLRVIQILRDILGARGRKSVTLTFLHF